MSKVEITTAEENMPLQFFLNKQITNYFEQANKVLEKELKDPKNKMQIQDYQRILELSDNRMMKMVKELQAVENSRSKPTLFKRKIDDLWKKIKPDEARPRHITDESVIKLWVKNFIDNSVEKFKQTIDINKHRVQQHVNFAMAIPNDFKELIVEQLNESKKKVLKKAFSFVDKQGAKLQKELRKTESQKPYQPRHAEKNIGKSPLDISRRGFSR